MLNGYDITNMSNDDINLIMKGVNPETYDPDKRLEPKKEACVHHRTKIFSAHDPEHLAKTINTFFDEHENIAVMAITPYTFTDRGTSKHCCFLYYVEL